MTEKFKDLPPHLEPEAFPEELEIAFRQGGRRQVLCYQKVVWPTAGQPAGLRYGENPGQPAALYKLVNGNLVIGDVRPIEPNGQLAADPELLQQGKHPGRIAIRDVDIALSVLRYAAERPTCVIVKHNNPCGAAKGPSLAKAFQRAYLANRIGTAGACAAFNRPVDQETAEALLATQLDVVVAPQFTPEALARLSRQPALCLLRIGNIDRLASYVGRPFLDFSSLMDGGLIAQLSVIPVEFSRDNCRPAKAMLHRTQEVRCKRQPTGDEWDDLLFAWHVSAAATSDSIVFVKQGVTVCIGIGGQDRASIVQAARDKAYHKLADRLAWERFKAPFHALHEEQMSESIWTDAVELKGGLIGASMASDGAIHHADALEVAFREGVTAVIQPGGSPADGDLIRVCNEYNATMVFTGQRTFRH